MKATKAERTQRACIVIAWVENDGLRATGQTVRRDLNYFPEFEACPKPHACVWLNRGSAADRAKAEAYASTQGHSFVRVYSLPTSTKDCLAVAKSKIMREQGLREDSIQ